MKGLKLVLGIVLGVLLLTVISWAEESVEVFQGDTASSITSCWKEELVPVYLCVNTVTGTTRFSKWMYSFQTKDYGPICVRNEEMIEAFFIVKKSHFIDFGEGPTE